MRAPDLFELGGIAAIAGGLRAAGGRFDSRQRALDPAYGVKGPSIPHGQGIA
ncbi:MAG TPA: hypothetical protein VMS43_14585 [Allosphingosinicella sp.]|nr:hypothetical protein [Allosphingosinicella sp.]